MVDTDADGGIGFDNDVDLYLANTSSLEKLTLSGGMLVGTLKCFGTPPCLLWDQSGIALKGGKFPKVVAAAVAKCVL
jgi:hypothetical protein